MKRIITLALTALALSACGGTRYVMVEASTTPPTTLTPLTTVVPTTTQAPTTTRVPRSTIYIPTPEEGLVNEARTIPASTNLYFNDVTVVEFGWLVCDSLATGSSGRDIANLIGQVVARSGGTTDDAGYAGAIAGAAVRWLCPEYADRAQI